LENDELLSLTKDEASALLVLAARCIELDTGRRVFKGVHIPKPPIGVTLLALPAIQRCKAWVVPK
jgi:hypothetical protein